MRFILYIALFFCVAAQGQLFDKYLPLALQQASGGAANLFDGLNAADKENEVDGTANTFMSGTDYVISSVTTGPTPFDGSYSLLFDKNTANGVDAIGGIDCPGVSNGDTVTISVRVQEVTGTSWTIALRTFRGWAVEDLQNVTAVGSWTEYTLSGTATQDNPQIEIKALTTGNLNDKFAADAVTIILVP